MLIRQAVEDDATALKALLDRLVMAAELYVEGSRRADIDRFTREALVHLIARDAPMMPVAEDDAGLVGFCLASDQHGPVWIDWIAVAPEVRGQGVAGALLAKLADTARGRGAARLWCDSLAVNAAAIAMLERSGFIRIAQLPNHWWGQDYLLWERPLA
jgi:ribosomal protein S18 acetylase RimI-like enzyme